jgi:hypothetical protein
MKPSFALNLSHEGIGLLHRTIRGWSVVGEVALDAPDLGGAMAFLRSTALGLETRGITTKLILPASQVLYTTVTAPGPSAARRRAQIAAALEGKTPYAVSDLVFDWSGTGSAVQVAVVARETLDEAQHFATEHRFNPVSFVAIPETGQFAGEPFFGTAPSAAALLAGDKVERDQDPVRIVSRAAALRPEDLAAQASVAPAAPEIPPAKEQVADAVEPLPDDVTTVEPAAPDAGAASAKTPSPEVPPESESDPLAESPPPEGPAAVEPAPAPERAPEPEPTPVPLMLGGGVTEPTVIDADPPAETATTPPLPKGKRDKPETAATAAEDRPTPTFSTRRSAQALEAAEPPTDRAAPRIGVPPPRDVTPPPTKAPAAKAPATAAPAGGVAATAVRAAAMPDAVRAALAAQNARSTNGRTARRPAPAPTKPATKPPAKTKPGAEPELSRFLPRAPSRADAVAPTGEPGAIPLPPRPATEAEAMTVFGERRKDKGRRAPRYLGLILTVLLLALLGAVALWSSLYLSQATPPKPASTETAAATSGAPAAAPPAGETAAAAPQPAVKTSSVPESSVPDQPNTSADPQAVADVADKAMTVPDAASLGATDAVGDVPAAGSTTAAPAPMALLTTPEVSVPARPEAAGAIALASVDPRLAPATTTALPGPGADSAPAVPPLPPAAPAPPVTSGVGATAVPQATAPAAIVPPTPTMIAPVVETPPAVEAAPAVAGPVSEPPPGADPALAKFKPKPRPAALAAEAPVIEPPTTEAAPTADTGSALAPASLTLRPKPRPTTGAFAPDATGSTSAPADGTSTLAVASSPRPADRPKALNTVQPSASTGVAAALAAAGTATTARPPAAPTVDAEPQPVSAPMPSLPENTSVATESTVNGALNLNRINLIGVFGTTSDRSALVRMPGGKVVRVQVGDTLDGGRIAAIGEDNLYYVKNGQNVQLRMPNG